MATFAHLHVHSHYSMMRGVDTLETLALAARDRGMDRFALTDTNALYGFVFYRQICDEAGLKAIAGAEIVESARTVRRAGAGGNGNGRAPTPGRAVLLARGREGYKSLCRVITERHLDPSFTIASSVRSTPGLIPSETARAHDAPRCSCLRGAGPGRRDTALARQWALLGILKCHEHVHFVHPEAPTISAPGPSTKMPR
jgi:DNA polymerase III alpha subunit